MLNKLPADLVVVAREELIPNQSPGEVALFNVDGTPINFSASSNNSVPLKIVGYWDADTSYNVGDVVTFDAYSSTALFRAVTPSVGIEPVTLSGGEEPVPVFSDAWQMLADDDYTDGPGIYTDLTKQDPRPTGSIITLSDDGATGGTVTYQILAGVEPFSFPLEFTVAAPVDPGAVRTGICTAVEWTLDDLTKYFDITDTAAGVTIEFIGGFLAPLYDVASVAVTDDSLTWDGDPGTPTIEVTSLRDSGVGSATGMYIADESAWLANEDGQWERVVTEPNLPSTPIEVLGRWVSDTEYTTGAVVSWTAGPYFTLFRATADSTGEAPAVTVEGNVFFSESWEILGSFTVPQIVYQAGVFDPNPVGDVVTIEAAPGSLTATGGTFTAGIVYGDNALPIDMTLPYDFSVAEIRAVFDAVFDSDSTGMIAIESGSFGYATIQGIGMLAAYPVTAVSAEDIDLTWDATPGTPSASITDPGFSGVGAVPGLFLGVGEGWVPWININGTWYSLVTTGLLTAFLTDLSTAATIGDINAAATNLLANL